MKWEMLETAIRLIIIMCFGVFKIGRDLISCWVLYGVHQVSQDGGCCQNLRVCCVKVYFL